MLEELINSIFNLCMMKIAANITSRRGEPMSTERQKQTGQHPENEPNLKGTLGFVSILGIFLLVTWFGALMVFLAR